MRRLYLLCLILSLLASCSRPPQEEVLVRQQITKQRRLQTEKEYAEKQKYKVVIDAGHGAVDLGAHNQRCIEKNLCLTTAQLLEKHLSEKGYKIYMTRASDTFLSLKQRTDLANKLKADLYVSIHFNAAKNSHAHGVEIFYYNKDQQRRSLLSKALASHVIKKILSKTGATSRGVKQGNFHVIRETKMPAILVEGGFITNPKEAKLLADKRYLDRLAFAISEGVDRFIMERKTMENQ